MNQPLSRSDCLTGATLAAENASGLCDAADRVAAGQPGTAVSLLITALEKAVKAWALPAAFAFV